MAVDEDRGTTAQRKRDRYRGTRRARQDQPRLDLGRQFVAPPTPLYTWWSYRAKDWEASNRGRRLDHMWVTPDIRNAAQSHRVVQPARSWERPSDHIPLVTEFAF